MTTSKSFNQYTEWRGSSPNNNNNSNNNNNTNSSGKNSTHSHHKNPYNHTKQFQMRSTTTYNHSNNHSNSNSNNYANHSHELNQHSLQQRGKVGGMVKQVNMNITTAIRSSTSSRYSNNEIAWPGCNSSTASVGSSHSQSLNHSHSHRNSDNNHAVVRADDDEEEEVSKGGVSKGCVSTDNNRPDNDDDNMNSNSNTTGSRNNSNNNNRTPSPVITAKNARNFWKSKEEKPFKIGKAPTTYTTINSTKNNCNTNNAKLISNHDSSGVGVGVSGGNSISSSSSTFATPYHSPSRNSVGSSCISSGITTREGSRGGDVGGVKISTIHDNNYNIQGSDQQDDDKSSHYSYPKRKRQPNKLVIDETSSSSSTTTTTTTTRNIKQDIGREEDHDDTKTGFSNQHRHPQHTSIVESINNNNRHTNDDRANNNNNKMKNNKSFNDSKNNINTTTDDGIIGEMQIKLDIAAAQLLTEEMKNKDLNERFMIYKNETEAEVLSMRKELERMKKEERMKEDEYDIHVQELKTQLLQMKHYGDAGDKDISHHHKEDAEDRLKMQQDENEKLKVLVKQQKIELNELCSEVQRLQSNHKDDSGMMNHMIKSLERDKNDMIRKEELYQNEIVSLKAKLEEQVHSIKQQQQQQGMQSIQQDDFHNIRKEFKKLAEEIERLEKELEAVTEDRDELLRVSVLYHNEQMNGGKSDNASMVESTDQENELKVVKKALEESEATCQKLESRIHYLEKRLNSEKELESLDLSAIDFENASFLASEKQGKIVSLDEFNALKEECNKYQSDIASMNERIEDVEVEKNELNECLAEAMVEIEKLVDDKNQTSQRHETFVEDLMSIIKDRDQEIERLQESSKNESSRQDINASDSLREELLNMVEWLNSSNSVNGSPSIECMLTDPSSSSNKDNSIKEGFGKFQNDDPVLSSVFEHVQSLKREISFLKNQKQRNPTNNTSSLFIKAKMMSKKIIEELHLAQGETLRSSLHEAADLINTLVETIPANQSKDASRAEKYKSSDDEDLFNKQVPISTFELSKKDDEIVDLKVLVSQLREELNEAKDELSNKDDLGEIPTPTKSNRSSRFQKNLNTSWKSNAQSSNEEDDMRARMAESEISRLQNDLKRKCNIEETLKGIIRDTSIRLTAATGQIQSLSNEKNEIQQELETLKAANLELQESLTKAEENQNQSQRNDVDNSDGAHTLELELSQVKSDLKTVSKERKKLKKSLTEAVEMLNALQEHILTAEKERKRMKKQLRAVVSKEAPNTNSEPNIPETNTKDFEAPSQADQMENQSIILQLRSHIVALDHEICTLNDRIDELDVIKTSNNKKESETSFINNEEIKMLQAKLKETENAYKVTKSMLEEVSEVNRELLKDLKETEKDEAATLEELRDLKIRLRAAHEEIDAINTVASSTLSKYRSLIKKSSINQTVGTVEIIKWLYNYSLTFGEK